MILLGTSQLQNDPVFTFKICRRICEGEEAAYQRNLAIENAPKDILIGRWE